MTTYKFVYAAVFPLACLWPCKPATAAAALLVLCGGMTLASCAGKRLATDTPGSVSTPYVRLATYNAVIAEANLALAKSVRTAAEVQLLSPSTTSEIFGWQEQVARTSKTLALALSDSAVDIRSPRIVALLNDFAAPIAVERWLRDMDKPEQQQVVVAVRTLTNTVALVLREFAGRDAAIDTLAYRAPQRPPGRANLEAWLAANDAQVAIGIETPGSLRDFGRLWQRRAAGIEAFAQGGK